MDFWKNQAIFNIDLSLRFSESLRIAKVEQILDCFDTYLRLVMGVNAATSNELDVEQSFE